MELVGGFLQQSVEKIDRTRQVALEALHHLVHSELELVGHDVLRSAVPLLPCVIRLRYSSLLLLPEQCLLLVNVNILLHYFNILHSRSLTSAVILPKTEKEKKAVAMREGDVFLQNVEYNNPSVLFPRAMVVIKSPDYRHSFLRGLVVSIGKSV